MKAFVSIFAMILVASCPATSLADDYVPEPFKAQFNVELMNEKQNGRLGCALMGNFVIMELGPERPLFITFLVATSAGTTGAGLAVAEMSPKEDVGQIRRIISVRSFEISSNGTTLRVGKLKKVSDDQLMPRVGSVTSEQARAMLKAHSAGELIEIHFSGAPRGFPDKFRYKAELNSLDSDFLEYCLKRLP